MKIENGSLEQSLNEVLARQLLTPLHHRLHHDHLSKLDADTEARVADLADQAGLADQRFDYLILAETYFAQALRDFIGGTKLLDAYRCAETDLVQRTNR